MSVHHLALNDPRKGLCGEYVGVYSPDKTASRRAKVTCERCIAEIVAAQMAPQKSYKFPWSVDPVFPVSRGED